MAKVNYDELLGNALRYGVFREVLKKLLKNGFGDHHFYITFKTDFPGVVIADYLKVRYPDDMTIVLQHQFFGLSVDDDHFSVVLSFDSVQERIVIPYNAITQFNDPSAPFGLKFPEIKFKKTEVEIVKEPEMEVPAGVISFTNFKNKKK